LIISVARARQYAASAGFTGSGLDTIVAIAQAESSLNTLAQGHNTDGSIDRGILQINSRWHAEVTDSCAYDPLCSFQQGYRISNRGTSFTPWSTYTSGAYRRYLTLSGGSKGTGNAWYNFPLTHGYITGYQGPGTDTPHYAEDIGTPLDTPFFFLESGTIQKADYQDWGGEVFLKPDKPNRPQEYVYHLDMIEVQPGEHVLAGQEIGLTGGQTSGGHHPTNPRWSTGPHAHFGEFTNYTQSPIGEIPYGPDPSPLIAEAKAANITGIGEGGASPTDTSGVPSDPKDPVAIARLFLTDFPGFAGIALALDELETFPGLIWYDDGNNILNAPGTAVRSIATTVIDNLMPLFFRGTIISIGLILVAGLLWNAASGSGLVQVAGQAGATAAVAA